MPACSFSQDARDNIGVLDGEAHSAGAWAFGAARSSAWGAGLQDQFGPINGGMFPHGSKVYMIDDADGFAYVTLDSADMTGMPFPTVNIWTHIDSTGYEDSDAIRVWVTCADGSTTEVLSGTLDDNAHPIGAGGVQMVENMWVAHEAALPATCGAATLSFGCQSNSNAEECWFDLVQFYNAPPPPPTITISDGPYVAGTPIDVTFTGATSNTDWVGFCESNIFQCYSLMFRDFLPVPEVL